ncbi:probable peroxidase 61 [Asparagus officinalis]|uniref:probable peroxidase 61 n=1 Tax=Asparagus officinalis TaxID=4686 RepID=UPI00098E6E10|nr:probable peroxidase 61 [Asparagus officinalis]
MGKKRCHYIHDRLYNFNNTDKPDECMDPSLVAELRKTCTPNTTGSRISNETVYLNPTSGSSNHSFQSSYFDHVLKNRGVLRIDQQMITIMDGIRIANEFANGFEDFKRYFALGMARLGSLGVLTGK